MNYVAAWNKISDLHENPHLVQFATRPVGRLLLWMTATCLLWPSRQIWWISPLLAIFLVRPAWRTYLLCAGSLAYLLQSIPLELDGQTISANTAVLTVTLFILFLAFRSAHAFRSLPGIVQDRPVFCFHVFLWPLMICVWAAPLIIDAPWENFLEPFRWILPLLTWRISYLLLAGKRGSVQGSGFLDHLWYCLPSFGGTNVPYGKGSDYLDSTKAEKTKDLSRIQLSGIKLLLLSKFWIILQQEMSAVLYGKPVGLLGDMLAGRHLGLTRLGELIGQNQLSWVPGWASLFSELVFFTLGLAATGHLIIGILRLFGYGVFRNTYKPLLAESIVEFWNRLYYYFKELLVEFFFYPVFARYFKKQPNLRMFAAVMSAAFLGNVYFHVLRDLGILGRAGFAGAAELLLPRIFYAFLLGIGVFVSMQRQNRRRGLPYPEGKPKILLRFRNIGIVWLFYSLIHIWNVSPMELTFDDRTRFFLSLFGLS